MTGNSPERKAGERYTDLPKWKISMNQVLELPDEDGPRFALADALEETGFTARAELIRVQCELARLHPGEARFVELSRREYELLQAYEYEWKRQEMSLMGLDPDHVQFRRGVIEYLRTIDFHSTDQAVRFLEANPTIREWECDTDGYEEFSLRKLLASPQAKNLKRLCVLDHGRETVPVGELLGPTECRLQWLSLIGAMSGDDLSAILHAPLCEQLKEFEMGEADDRCCEIIQTWEGRTRLRFLSLGERTFFQGNNRFTVPFPALEELHFDARNFDPDSRYSASSIFPALRRCTVNYTGQSPYQTLAQIIPLEQLESLRLEACDPSDLPDLSATPIRTLELDTVCYRPSPLSLRRLPRNLQDLSLRTQQGGGSLFRIDDTGTPPAALKMVYLSGGALVSGDRLLTKLQPEVLVLRGPQDADVLAVPEGSSPLRTRSIDLTGAKSVRGMLGTIAKNPAFSALEELRFSGDLDSRDTARKGNERLMKALRELAAAPHLTNLYLVHTDFPLPAELEQRMEENGARVRAKRNAAFDQEYARVRQMAAEALQLEGQSGASKEPTGE
ncbi:MAG: hypothetical protein G01um101425_643 [Candidatus Peregrinibacteria bacterium Gr01-1014_25]|nr:MAG: hypothetical protein G01um101425_643 [Candidatus Peregrinibacteria bacterium Gr01-1014_25]